ncbi:ParB/RepB/Spo0J family partition protein [Cellulomonas taurus]|uniref:ParB/RepB/Spo0J family partition protein n=1 Tax=Cellulomonas taurus TaxID=2729175 RepID=UPI00145D6D32|nr:ParB N-terminal domain-containing protein [Cellulomonas taurus]
MSPRDLRMLPLRSIRPHPRNPRVDLGDLTELAADIRDNGIIEPLVVVPGSWGKPAGVCADCDEQVRRNPTGVLQEHTHDGIPCPGGSEPAGDDWTVLAGHRRRQASIAVGQWDAPCVVRTDLRSVADQVGVMLRENGHRQNLTPIEEARGFEQLTLEGLTATRIAQQVKVSKKTVDRRLALLALSEDAKKQLHTGVMTLDDAEAMVNLPPAAAKKVLRVVGTKEFRQEVASQRIGTDVPTAVAAELRSEFAHPYLTGTRRPPRDALPRLRKGVVATLASRLPRTVTRTWLGSLGVSDAADVARVDPDRALLALALAIQSDPAGQYELLKVLGYELSPVEIDLIESNR